MSLALNGTNGVTYNDGTQQSSAPVGKNLIINGNMQIAQRGTSVAGIATSGYYTVDRWLNLFSGAGTFTVSQDTDVPSGQGFANSLKLDCTTANPSLDATDFIFVVQKMEGQNLQQLSYGTANAKTITLSFWIKSNLTGSYVCNLYSADNSQLISATYTVNSADTWEQKTVTFQGDISNALDNDNNNSLELEFWFTGGSNFTSGTLYTSWTAFSNANRNVGGQTNLGSSTLNYVNITGVQLEVGDTATDFENLQYGTQLQLCQRYYWQGIFNGSGTWGGGSGQLPLIATTLPATFRVPPTSTLITAITPGVGTGANVYTLGSIAFVGSMGTNSVYFGFNITVGASHTNLGCLMFGNTFSFSAEL